jgi:ATP-dependent DNA ligase
LDVIGASSLDVGCILADRGVRRGVTARSSRRQGSCEHGLIELPVMPPVAPMLAKPAAAIPLGHFYEPKWDGFRSIVFRDGDEVEIGSRKERPMTRYFPDVVEAVRREFPPCAVIDGEIVIAGDGGLDFWALQQRIHPAASRVTRLAGETPASFIAFDLLALGEDDLMSEPFAYRRAALERALANAAPPVHLTPITRDEQIARAWFDRFEGAGLDGLIAKPPDLTYQPDKRVMTKIKHVRTADCVVAGYRVHKSAANAIGSLLLGLYVDAAAPRSQWIDHTSGLAPVGVIGAFPMARRRELFAELQPLVVDVAEHPWSWAAEIGQAPEGGSRWNPKKDLSFVALWPVRVVEVRYDYLEGARFRHPPQFVRWRPDRDPASCGYAQLEQPTPFDLADVLAGRLAKSV